MKVWAYASLREMLLLFLTLSLFPGQWPFSKKGGAKRKRKAPKSPEYSSPLKGYSDKFKNALYQFLSKAILFLKILVYKVLTFLSILK